MSFFRNTAWPGRFHGYWEDINAVFTASPVVDKCNEQRDGRGSRLVPLLHGLRVPAVAIAKAPDLYYGRDKWSLHVTGKAAPESELPVSDALIMADFARYAAFQGSPPVSSGRGAWSGDDTRHMKSAKRPDRQACIRRAGCAGYMPDDPPGAATRRGATTHRFATVPTLVRRASTPTCPSPGKTCRMRHLIRTRHPALLLARPDGQIRHPYGGGKDGIRWMVQTLSAAQTDVQRNARA